MMICFDDSKCIGCGLCAGDCFPGAITMAGDRPVFSAPEACIACGHCIAICPANAVESDALNMAEVREYDKESYHVDAARLLNLMKFRRSTRHFKAAPVSEEHIRALIDAGRWCPTAKNLQGTSYIVARDNIPALLEAALARLEEFGQKMLKTTTDENDLRRAGNFIRWLREYRMSPEQTDPLFFHAPLLILVVSEGSGAYDAAAAAAYMELQAAALGLGCLYSGYFCAAADKNETIAGLLSLRPGQRVVRCLVLGHPDVRFRRTVPRNQPEIKYL